MAKQSFARRLRRVIRKHLGPKQKSLKPVFSDSLIFHSQVRVGKRGPKSQLFPKGKPTAVVVTKIRTMKKSVHKDYGTHRRKTRPGYTWLGKIMRPKHWDEYPQIINVLKGTLSPVGLRPLLKQEYNKLPPELKKIYDEVGPGLLGLPYACKSKEPSLQELFEVVQKFYNLWKKSPAKANKIFRKRIRDGQRNRELKIGKWLEKMKKSKSQ